MLAEWYSNQEFVHTCHVHFIRYLGTSNFLTFPVSSHHQQLPHEYDITWLRHYTEVILFTFRHKNTQTRVFSNVNGTSKHKTMAYFYCHLWCSFWKVRIIPVYGIRSEVSLLAWPSQRFVKQCWNSGIQDERLPTEIRKTSKRYRAVSEVL